MTTIDAVHIQPPLASGPGSTYSTRQATRTDPGLPPQQRDWPGRSEPLPGGSPTVDLNLAHSAALAIAQNIGVDYARIAALMMLLHSELARAARDGRVLQIEQLAQRMHEIADDIRTSAMYALVGSIVSSSIQIASAGINIGGGLYGMSLTSRGAKTPPPPKPNKPPTAAPGNTPNPDTPDPNPSASPATGSPGQPPEPAAAASTADTTPDPATPPTQPADTAPGPDDPQAPGQAPEPEPEPGQVDNLSPGQKQDQDFAAAQRFAARAQGVALVTQGASLMVSSIGELIKSVVEHEGRKIDAYIKDSEAEAEEMRAYMESVKTFSEAMQKAAHDMLQSYQQMQEGIHQTSRAVWSRA